MAQIPDIKSRIEGWKNVVSQEQASNKKFVENLKTQQPFILQYGESLSKAGVNVAAMTLNTQTAIKKALDEARIWKPKFPNAQQ